MFQAVFFQERDARRDMKAHHGNVEAPPEVKMPPNPEIQEVTLAKHPTRENLVGGKGLFLNLHR